jgi:methanogenic corrinoid protein MtbC1
VDRFVDLLLLRDVVRAKDAALDLLDDGTSLPEVLGGLVAPAQREIGDRWHRNELNVADEHGATAVADAVVTALTVNPRPPPSGPTVIVTCAEGEWHVLASRLLAETLRADGCDVIFLGGSMPPLHLARFLDHLPPDVVAVSCSTPLAFEGVLGLVEVVHAAGIPVIAGGGALGRDPHRAQVLGADLWAPDAVTAADRLWQQLPTALHEPAPDTGAALELALRSDAIVEAALAELGRRFPPLHGYSRQQRARTEEDLRYIVQFAQAALLTRDPRVFDEFVTWLMVLLLSRGLDAEALSISLDGLAHAASSPPQLTELIERHLAGSPPTLRR